MLMAGAYFAASLSQSCHCSNSISPTILAILAKVLVANLLGKDGKDLQYTSANN